MQTKNQIGSLLETWTRARFYNIFLLLIATVAILAYFVSLKFLYAYIVVLPLFFMGMHDALQTQKTVLRNFPLLGRIRYALEAIRPEIRQYFIEGDQEEHPFSREKRSLIYQRSKGQLDTLPFGTKRNVYRIGYEWINHSLAPVTTEAGADRVMVGKHNCSQPYDCSILNVSAMSFGSLSNNAILALNKGAKMGNFAHNTGEGGLSPYHLKHGGDIIWQIGTGYFSARKPDGTFDRELFKSNALRPEVKMIEIKLSQGAKPAHGGILPGEKVSKEIAEIRGVEPFKTVISPPAHSAFSTPVGLLEFITELRELSGGKPVGFKLCVGKPREFFAICKAMIETKLTPDFITVDGAEGGTGAAPLEFTNSMGMPLNDGLVLVRNGLVGLNLHERITVIAAGKITSGFDIIQKIALGAQVCNCARAMMFALGCIQALKCNTNQCPTGVATQDPDLVKGLVVEPKSKRVDNFHRKTVESALELLGAAGLRHPRGLTPHHFYRRTGLGTFQQLDEIFPYIEPGALLRTTAPDLYIKHWEMASHENF